MSRIVTSGYKGLVVHSNLITPALIAATSTHTQAGPHAGGICTPTIATGSVAPVLGSLEVLGDQDAPITLDVLRSGNPGLGDNMQLGYRFSSDPTTSVRGHTPPSIMTDHQGITGFTAQDSVDASVGPTGVIYVTSRLTGTPTASYSTYDPATGLVQTGLSGPISTAGASTYAGIAIAHDANGIMYWVQADSNFYWHMWRKTATGWEEVAYEPFGSAKPNAAAGNLRLLILPSGEWAFFEITDIGANVRFTQWASANQGASWTQVVTNNVLWQGLGDVCVTAAGNIGLVMPVATSMKYYSVSSAFTSLVAATPITIAASVDEIGWVSADPSGRLWAVTRENATSTMFGYYSDNEGSTWTSDTAAKIYYANDMAPLPILGRMVQSIGSFFLLYQIDTAANGIRLMRMGGWENINPSGTGSGGNSSMPLCATWTNIGKPDSQPLSWTMAGAGVDTLSSTDGMLVQTTFAGLQTRSYTFTPVINVSATAQMTCAAKFRVDATSTGTSVAHNHGIKCQVATGAANGCYGLQVWAGVGSFRVLTLAGVSLASITVDTATYTHFRVFVKVGVAGTNTGIGAVYYRKDGTDVWTLAYSSSTIAFSAPLVGAFVWGHVTAPGLGTATSAWQYLWVATTDTLNIPIRSRLVAAADQYPLLGKVVTTRPMPLGAIAASGNRLSYVRATSGPVSTGETYPVSPLYDYPIASVFPTVSPSPRVVWRSSNNSEQILEIDVDPTYGTSLGRSIGLGLINTKNLSSVQLQGYTGGAWGLIGSWSNQSVSLNYTLTGNVARINGGTNLPTYVTRNQYVGATLNLNSRRRTILSHTEGIWSSLAGKHVEFCLSGIDGTETASSGCYIESKSGVLVLHGLSAMYTRFRLLIPADATVSYFEIGNMVLGQLVTAGQQFGRGATASYERNMTETTTRDLVTRVKRLGPVRRSWSWPWSDPMDQTSLHSVTPDYLSHDAGTEGLANFRDVPYLFSGLLEELKSGETPVIALNPIPTTSGTTVTDPTQFLYGRLSSDVGIEHVLGTEGSTESLRMPPITFTELV